MRRGRTLAVFVVGCLVAAGCGDDGPTRPFPGVPVEDVDPILRAVVVSTRPCGDASSREASGVIVAPGRVVTAGHVVARAREVSVTAAGASGSGGRPAEVVALDLDADVAVLEVSDGAVPEPVPPVVFTRLSRHESVRLVGGATSGSVDLVVSRPVRIDIDGPRLGQRVERDGYELIGDSADGDSGAGVYDDRGRLGALVFARSDERADVVFAVEASEIVDALDSPPAVYRCDPARSRLVMEGP